MLGTFLVFERMNIVLCIEKVKLNNFSWFTLRFLFKNIIKI